MKASTKKMLEEAALWGKRHSGHGYSMARLVQAALDNESNPEIVD